MDRILKVGSLNERNKLRQVTLRNVLVILEQYFLKKSSNNGSLLKYNSMNFLSNTQCLRSGSIKTALPESRSRKKKATECQGIEDLKEGIRVLSNFLNLWPRLDKMVSKRGAKLMIWNNWKRLTEVLLRMKSGPSEGTGQEWCSIGPWPEVNI